MARSFAGSEEIYKSTNLLSASQGPWAFSAWIKPESLTTGTGGLFMVYDAGAVKYWRVLWDGSTSKVKFDALGYAGTDPASGAEITLTQTHIDNGCYIGFRYAGQSGEWASFLNGTKAIISSSRSFTLPTLSSVAYVGGTSPNATAEIAEVAVWACAPTDDEMKALWRGVKANQIARGSLAAYLPLHGYGSTEPDFAQASPFSAASAWALSTSIGRATHPRNASRALPVPLSRRWAPAWTLDIGERYAASVDLFADQDVDALGAVYPRTILNPESIQVVRELSSVTYGVHVPNGAQVELINAEVTLPTQIDGLALWLRADSLTGLADGDRVNAWTDDSRNGYSAAQGTVSKCPLYQAAEYNGLPCVRFDGSNDCLRVSSFRLPAFFTAFVVGKFTTGNPMFIEHGANANTDDGFYWYGTSGDTLRVRRTSGVASSASASWMGSALALVTASSGSAVLGCNLNGGVQFRSSVSALTQSIVSDALNIGSRNNGASLASNGDFCEIVVFDRALSDAEQRRVQIYLASKWGVTIVPAIPELYSPAVDWRGESVLLRRYDAVSGEVFREMSGVVMDARFAPGRVTFVLGSHDPSALRTQIPKTIVTVDDCPSAIDVGAPYPVVFGTAYVSPPLIGQDDVSDPGGVDYALSHIEDADGTDMDLTVRAAFQDNDGAPGVEQILGWAPGQGTPTYASTSTFTVSGDLRIQYPVGALVRVVTTASAGAWVYVFVASLAYSSNTTVTVNLPVLDTGMNTGGNIAKIHPTPTAAGTGYAVGDVLTITTGGSNGTVRVLAVSSGAVTRLAIVKPGTGYTTGTGKATSGGTGSGCTVNIMEICRGQVAADFFAEEGRYLLGSAPILSARMLDTQSGYPVVEVANSSYTDHADAVAQILSHPTWGLGQSVNAASLTRAQAQLSAAGLANACNWALGGDRQQLSAEDAINQLLMIYGGMIEKNESDEWEISFDEEPAAPWLTFGFGDGEWNNVIAPGEYARAALGDVVRTLKLRYGPQGITKHGDDGPAWFPINSYRYGLQATVVAVGAREEIISLPQLTSYVAGKYALAYIAKRRRYEDEQLGLVCGYEARWLFGGELVKVHVPLYGISKTMRVIRVVRGLNTFQVQLAGYDSSIYYFDPDDVSVESINDSAITETDAAEDGALRLIPGDGANLLRNSDFSALLRPAWSFAAGDSVPGWNFYSGITVVTSTKDVATVGGAYVTIAVAVSATTMSAKDGMTSGSANYVQGVRAGKLYVGSVYADTATGWVPTIEWVDSGGSTVATSTPSIRVDPNDINGKGWKRYYWSARAPRDPSAAVILTKAAFKLTIATGTYKFDAFQFEESTGSGGRPSKWKRASTWGVDPAVMLTGDLTVRRTDDLEGGTGISHPYTDVACSGGTSVASNLIPAGSYCFGVTVLVRTTITGSGVTSFQVGDGTTADLWATGVALTSGTGTDGDAFKSSWVPTYYKTAKSVTLTFTGGSASAGSVRVVAHCVAMTGPTS